MNRTPVRVGSLTMGGGEVYVQSMCNTKTTDISATAAQIQALFSAGCALVRVSVPDEASALALRELKNTAPCPLVADIHFDVRLAELAAENGADKLRMNPGNLKKSELDRLAACLRSHHIPVRVGVNGGSLEKELLQKYAGPTPQALAESALTACRLLTERGVEVVVSVKASQTQTVIAANRLLHKSCPHPIHLGVTEAGLPEMGIARNAVAMGVLLSEGIGDTIRVSLTGDPLPEAAAGIEILRSLGFYKGGVELIACPTCARTAIPVEEIARRVQRETAQVKTPLRVAVMGCVVNGPGEAREADIGLAGGNGKAALFEKGQLVTSGGVEEITALLIDKILHWS